jgi:serine/threonine protein kinase
MIALAPGATIGRYVLESRIAAGGMAEVWLAQATGPRGFEKRVVIKSILPHLAETPEFVRLFVNEARIAAALQHPNIVQTFELGETEAGYFIAMEHIPGRTLRELAARARETDKVLPPWFVCRVAGEVCDALQYAHEAEDGKGRRLGVVHRDVTPENVMVTPAGDTKVLDFGVARASREPMTHSGILKGKFAYLAPEQIDTDEQTDHRADIYALGVVMYELVTARQPYRARTQIGLLRSIRDRDVRPAPPRQLAAWVPESLEALILKAIQKDPRRRFQQAIELRAALDQCLATLGLFPTRRHVAQQLEALFPTEDTESPSRRRPRGLPSQAAGTGLVHAETAVEEFEAGLEHIRSRDFPAARAALERALQLDPENRVYRSNLNMLRERLDEDRQSVDPMAGG